MSTYIQYGTKIEEIDLLDLFEPEEGSIDQIYGRVGNGKTYAATADILSRLSHGEVVYANWHIDWNGYDQRSSFLSILFGVLGFKKQFYKFSKENLKFIELDEKFIENFEKLTDCSVYLDEGHIVFDSYQHSKMSLRDRKAILHTRHFNRSIVIISQRPTAVHVSARANVNRFFKCEKLISWPFILFRKTEFQDMVNETVDEEQPLSTKLYIGSKRILNAYNSKYLRGGVPSSQVVHFDGYRVNYAARWALMIECLSQFLPSLSFHTRIAFRRARGSSVLLRNQKDIQLD